MIDQEHSKLREVSKPKKCVEYADYRAQQSVSNPVASEIYPAESHQWNQGKRKLALKEYIGKRAPHRSLASVTTRHGFGADFLMREIYDPFGSSHDVSRGSLPR